MDLLRMTRPAPDTAADLSVCPAGYQDKRRNLDAGRPRSGPETPGSAATIPAVSGAIRDRSAERFPDSMLPRSARAGRGQRLAAWIVPETRWPRVIFGPAGWKRLAIRLCSWATAPVAQGIEQRFPKPRAEVRVLPGAPTEFNWTRELPILVSRGFATPMSNTATARAPLAADARARTLRPTS
jgi:hypothetical protein